MSKLKAFPLTWGTAVGAGYLGRINFTPHQQFYDQWANKRMRSIECLSEVLFQFGRATLISAQAPAPAAASQ
jgi:hypothetical protein